MPFPSGVLQDPAALPYPYRALITADVSITTGGTFQDIATLGTLPAGTYLVGGKVVVSVVTAANQVTGKIWDGSVVFDASENTTGAAAVGEFSFGPTLLILQSPDIVKLSVTATGSAQTTVKASCPDNGAATAGFVTGIWALRIA